MSLPDVEASLTRCESSLHNIMTVDFFWGMQIKTKIQCIPGNANLMGQASLILKHELWQNVTYFYEKALYASYLQELVSQTEVLVVGRKDTTENITLKTKICLTPGPKFATEN